MKTRIIILSLILFVLPLEVFAQSDCPMDDLYPEFEAPPYFTGGLYKPHRTDLSNGNEAPSNAKLHAILVFCQFPDETVESTEWPLGQPPVFMDYMLAQSKNSSGDYWNRYSDQTAIMSDYYHEVSGGKLHLTGIVRHYIFDHNRSHYTSETMMNNEIYMKLDADPNITWTDFDLWRRVSEGNYEFTGDDNIDLIMMVRRHVPGFEAGVAGLGGSNFLIDPTNNLWINSGYSQYGSGYRVNGNHVSGPLGFNRYFGISLHEYGHFLWGPHSNTGIMTSRGGISINDLYGSPFELYKLGYIDPISVDFEESNNYSLEDISSRSSGSEMLKVPIGTDEYFLIVNRRKVSKYDVAMLGDTAKLEPFKNVGNYGKGVYIYHYKAPDFTYPGNQDLEAADGIFNWAQNGTEHPDWSNTDNVPLIIKDSYPSTINNDNGAWGLSNKDDINAFASGTPNYFSLGEKHISIGGIGKDRIITNLEEYWTSRVAWSDRWDAWNVGYNEIFSPYSNPNTKNWSNSQTGIFIQYYQLSNGTASFNIYRIGTNDMDEDEILELTPPSKPMGIKEEDCVYSNGHFRPKISWVHNTEPDMERTGASEIYFKRYKIYRSAANDMSQLPPDAFQNPENVYSHIATVDILSNETPVFVDDNIISGCALPDGPCPPNCWIIYPVRYRVQAVDMYEDESVLSDFANTTGIRTVSGNPGGEEGGDNPGYDGEVPTSYSLYQNYPNPFNPSTNIQFDLPNEGFVSIKIYNMLGREVATIVNEFRNAGSYIVGFNGSNLSSGIYYYKIKAGTFEATKRMVLIK